MNVTELIAELEREGVDKVKLGGFDVDGVLRGKYVSLDKFRSAVGSGFGFCDVIFGWDSADELYEDTGVTVTGWHTGYPDTGGRIDLDSYRRIPWEGRQPFFLVDFETPAGEPLAVSPRQLLKKVAARAEAMGFEAKASAEFEFWLFHESAASVRDKGYRDMTPLTPGMFGYSCTRANMNHELFSALFTQMREFDVQLEGLHTETGPGVLEAAIAYDDVVTAADRAALFKVGTKEICAQRGLIATFMAKWSASLPGSSGHLHQSLWRDGKTAFHDPDGPHQMSKVFRHYVAGILETMPDFAALYAPTINSYRRLVPGMWAPTRSCWAPENRTASLRTIHSPKPSSSRVEVRVTGADINPYIAIAGSMAAGLWGIENEIELKPAAKGNAYTLSEADAPSLPSSLGAAAERLRASSVAREILGADFVDHYVETRLWEVREAAKAVTDWELERYFEII